MDSGDLNRGSATTTTFATELSAAAPAFVPRGLAPNVTTDDNQQKKIDNENLQETGTGSDWQSVNKSPKKPQKKKSNFPLSRNFPTSNYPGEFVIYDGIRRFVVWSTDASVARRAIMEGRKSLIFMRGAPGSGKSTFAKSLAKQSGLIYSTDDYFQTHGSGYVFDKNRLEDAHNWNFQRVVQALSRKATPIVVDNTNSQLWEMTKYVKAALRNAYDIFFLEPDTPWRYDATECYRRNSHKVSYDTIERMIMNFEHRITLQCFTEPNRLRQPTRNSAEESIAPSSESAIKSSPEGSLFSLNRQNSLERNASTNGISISTDLAAADDSREPSLPLESPKEQRQQKPRRHQNIEESPTSKWNTTSDIGPPPGFLTQIGMKQWQLPAELAGGLSNDVTDWSAEIPAPATNSLIKVRDQHVQVSDKQLVLENMQHRRLSKHELDTDEISEERKVVPAPWAITCHKSVQCDMDENDRGENAETSMSILRTCFPDISYEDLEHVLQRCDSDLQWAINVLLDSGFVVNWSNMDDTGTAVKDANTNDDDESQVVQSQHPESSPDSSSADETAADSCAGNAVDVADKLTEEPLHCTMELSPDMATQLQQLFLPIFPGIPADLLSPSQLNVRLPYDLAAQLYQWWLDTQCRGEQLSAEAVGSDMKDADTNSIISSALFDEMIVDEQILLDEHLARRLEAANDYNASPSSTMVHPSKSLASKIKLQRLHEMFPGLDKNMLSKAFSAHNYHLGNTVNSISEMFCDALPVSSTIPQDSYAERGAQVTNMERADAKRFASMTYDEVRAEAREYYEQRQLNYKKAQEHYRKGVSGAAYYYAQRGHYFNTKFKEANANAATRILQGRKASNPPDVLDLHGLHVSEAISALAVTLRGYENRTGKQVKVITGQGKHSAGEPRIKASVEKFLKHHGYLYSESNPGVLAVIIK